MSADRVTWRTSSRSNESGDNCLEVADAPGVVIVRDSQDPQGPRLIVSRREFRRLVEGLKGR
ncbi:DUF397 domain-containing protein [Actinomadura sp. KC216]|nr:DUF397 domain-containing protein [Actinomadura sp. KC216]TDB85159.1 DUF397 domain-containing protein [Actinomadura sp. KC216]